MPPKDRDIAMVFQSYALYPTMTVRENITFGMESRGVPKAAAGRGRRARVAALLQIEPLLERKPGQLSGGQRQRVAMGRALVRDPELFLFDEPLSNLDAKLRVEMRTEIKKLHQRVGKTTVYVTHDQVEAMTLASRIAVMHQGAVQQFAEPRDGLRPAGQHVRRRLHGLAGDELHPGRAASTTAGAGVSAAGWPTAPPPSLPLPPSDARRPSAGPQVVLGIRPEHIYRFDPDLAGRKPGIAHARGAGRGGRADRRRDHGGAAARRREVIAAASIPTMRRGGRDDARSASTWRKACLFDPATATPDLRGSASCFATYPSLADRVVLVTGGASGIGADIVRGLAGQRRAGRLPRHAGRGRRGARRANSPAARTAPLFLRCDVTDIAALQAADRHGRASGSGRSRVLVNNAANDERHAIDEVTPEYWDRAQNVNLRHQFFAAQAVHPHMRSSAAARSSISPRSPGCCGAADMVAYPTAKAAVVGLTNALARAFGPDNIRVNAIAPGAVMTERQLRLWYHDRGSVDADGRAPDDPAASCSATRSPARRCSSPPTTAA